jgi:hypothetical protein
MTKKKHRVSCALMHKDTEMGTAPCAGCKDQKNCHGKGITHKMLIQAAIFKDIKGLLAFCWSWRQSKEKARDIAIEFLESEGYFIDIAGEQ